MKDLPKLFRLLEITRAQQQQGYVLSEIPKSEIGDLAQHHYLVTFFAWVLAQQATRAGGMLNIQKVLELSLIHDLGELFGGDISMPYARANPKAYQLAKKFEIENIEYLSTFFGDNQKHLEELLPEVHSPASDEAMIVKIADYVEVTHFKLYTHRLSKGDLAMAKEKILGKIKHIKDQQTKKAMANFLQIWLKGLQKRKFDELFEQAKPPAQRLHMSKKRATD